MDISVPYVLTTPVRTITFNHTGYDRFNAVGLENEYYIGDQDGLDGVPWRTPTDNRPQNHGGLVYSRKKGPRAFILEGAIVIRSTRIPSGIMIARNQMEQDLREAIDSLDETDGTLVWTPRGLSQHSLTVRVHEPEINFEGIEWRTFTFGLIAADVGYV